MSRGVPYQFTPKTAGHMLHYLLYVVCLEQRCRRKVMRRHHPIVTYPFFQYSVLQGTYCTIPGVFTPGITLQRTSVGSVRNSYPCQKLLQALYHIHTRIPRTSVTSVRPYPQYPGYGYGIFLPTQNFRELCTPVPQNLELL